MSLGWTICFPCNGAVRGINGSLPSGKRSVVDFPIFMTAGRQSFLEELFYLFCFIYSHFSLWFPPVLEAGWTPKLVVHNHYNSSHNSGDM